MTHDPRQLRPTELCRLLNSTPLGEVIKQRQMQEHRVQAGLRIGTHKQVDLFRYVAWLVQRRHAPKSIAPCVSSPLNLAEVADGALNLGGVERLSSKQASLIAALLTEPSQTAAAASLGISKTTVSRWMNQKEFCQVYRHTRRIVVDYALGRMQTATSQAVETLMSISSHGRRDSDRIRASMAILEYALRGLHQGEVVDHEGVDQHPVTTSDLVTILGQRLRQLDHAELSTPERSRLTASLSDALLKAISVGVLDQRLEAIQSVLLSRKKSKS